MAHLSDWHVFDPSDRKTYPTADAPVQVKFDDGKFEEGVSRMFFPLAKLLPCSSIRAWRYIIGAAQRQHPRPRFVASAKKRAKADAGPLAR
jgi:hypothetical protein